MATPGRDQAADGGAATPAGDGSRPHGHKKARWTAAVVVLIIAALLGGLAVVAGYLRTQVLDTNAYVETVAPLAADPVIQDALATRLTTEIVSRAELPQLATDIANELVARGAPARITALTGTLVSSITDYIEKKIRALLATPEFEKIWQEINRVAHTGLVTVLTGRQGKLLTSSGTKVTVDLGQLLDALKARLVAAGLTFVGRVPQVSIPYTVVESDKLPKLRTYTRWLDVAGVWLPYVALALMLGGILIAPNRRRGILTGVIMLGVFALLLLWAVKIGRGIYVDKLPSTVQSPDAATAVFDAVIQFLVRALQALLVAVALAVIAALLAGPSRWAVWVRRMVGRGLDATGRLLGSTGSFFRRTGSVVARFKRPVEIVLVLAAVILLIVAVRPSAGTVLAFAACLLLALAVVEVLARAAEPVAASQSI